MEIDLHLNKAAIEISSLASAFTQLLSQAKTQMMRVKTKSTLLKQKNKELYQFVFDRTPFYAESGGQVGDTGCIESKGEKISIIDTKKENELIIHFAEKLPSDLKASFKAVVEKRKRQMTMNNHSATHLLHAALRQVLGKHVEKKGSLVNEKILLLEIYHIAAMTHEEIQKV